MLQIGDVSYDFGELDGRMLLLLLFRHVGFHVGQARLGLPQVGPDIFQINRRLEYSSSTEGCQNKVTKNKRWTTGTHLGI